MIVTVTQTLATEAGNKFPECRRGEGFQHETREDGDWRRGEGDVGVGGDKQSLNDRWKGLGAKLLVVLPEYWLHSGRQQRRRLECSPTPLNL